MRTPDGHENREQDLGLPALIKRLAAIRSAIDEYRATMLGLERSRWTRTYGYRVPPDTKLGDGSAVEASVASRRCP